MLRIGVLSDTHLYNSGNGMAFLQDLAARRFAGTDLILHAGDVGDPDILAAFTDAPVHAVRGNTDPADPRRQVNNNVGASIAVQSFDRFHFNQIVFPAARNKDIFTASIPEPCDHE